MAKQDIRWNSHSWLLALESRNLSVHTYDEETAERIIKQIRNEFYPLLVELRNKLKAKN